MEERQTLGVGRGTCSSWLVGDQSLPPGNNDVSPVTAATRKEKWVVPKGCNLRSVKYMDNVIEQDHRCKSSSGNIFP